MFLIYLFHFLRGYVIIKIEGRNIEDFINLCTGQKILLWNIAKKGRAMAAANVPSRCYYTIKLIARECGCRIHVMKRVGLPFFLQKLKKRKTLCVGLVAAVFTVLWLCSRLWAIEIVNVDSREEAYISQILARNGISVGMPLNQIDPFALQKNVLATNDTYSWFWMEVKGTKAYVEVRYRVQKPEIVPSDEICNIIAAKSGIINRMVVRMGEAAVEEGTAVAEGQLLVSGEVPNEAIGEMYVHSDADIVAKVTRTVKKQRSLLEFERKPTGAVTKKYGLELFGKNFNLFLGTPKYTHYDGVIREKQLEPVKDFLMPFKLRIYEYQEVEQVEVQRSKEEVEEELRQELFLDLKQTIGEKNLISADFSTAMPDENTVEVTMTAQVLENIGKKEPIPDVPEEKKANYVTMKGNREEEKSEETEENPQESPEETPPEEIPAQE